MVGLSLPPVSVIQVEVLLYRNELDCCAASSDVARDDSRRRRFLAELSYKGRSLSAMCTYNPVAADVLHGTILSATGAANRVLGRRSAK